MSKIIPLTKNKISTVDDGDYEYLSQFKWTYVSAGTGYASARIGGKSVYMHRLIMQPEAGQDVDHINHDTLYNCRANLRNCTHIQNLQNRKVNTRNTSGMTGVSWYKPRQMWRAQINLNGKRKSLGVYETKEEAATAYKNASVAAFGEYAT